MKPTIRSPDWKSYVSALLLLSLLMAACGKEPSPIPPPPSEAAQAATSSPVPPTATPAPTPSATTPPATPSPSSDATGTSVAVDRQIGVPGGLSLVVPAGWEALNWEGLTHVMESGSAQSFPKQTPEVFALVTTQWLFDLVDMGADVETLKDPADLLAASHALQWLVDNLQRSTESEALLDIGGYPAYSVTTKDKEDRHEYVVLILAKDIGRVAILDGKSSPERWEDVLPTFEAIAGSLTLSELQIEHVDPTLDELEFPVIEDLGDEPFVSEEYGYQIAYPEGWLILEGMRKSAFSLDAAHSLCGEISGMEWSECHTPIAVTVWIPESDELEGFDGSGSKSDNLYLLELLAMSQTPGPTYIFRTLETFDLNGVPTIGAKFHGADYAHDEYQSFRGYVAIVEGDAQAAVIWATAPTAVWQQFRLVFGAMLDSFVFSGN